MNKSLFSNYFVKFIFLNYLCVMIIETTYDQGQYVYIVIVSYENVKIIESKISSIDLQVTASGVRAIYNCSVDRKITGTEVNGMPQFYTVTRNEDNIFKTSEDCANRIIKKAAWAAAKVKN